MTARIPPLDPHVADAQTKELFNTVKSKFGSVPNALKTMGNSAAVLEGFLSLEGALSKGSLSRALREEIALAVSEVNGCDYCLAAHSLTGKIAGLQPNQILDARLGRASNPKDDAAVRLAQRIAEQKGNVSDEELAEARKAGLTDRELVEIVGNVAAMTYTNFLNNLAHTDIDFPKVAAAA